MELGNQIKALRTRRGVTQETLAEKLGVSPQAVSKREPKNGEVYRLLADMENQLAYEHEPRGSEYALEAIRREPENDSAHNAYVQANWGPFGDWASTNHHELIDFYKTFVAGHPHWRAGYLWLLDLLIWDGRLEEAREYCETMDREVETGYRTAMFLGEIA